ncbi:MAG: M42 family metallopeptidase [Ruminococcaceae bacterium]|nr:M42 family metallopeptidase [Oscillospiraceae bacterium]
MDKKYVDFAVLKTGELLSIDSPTGYTERAAEWVKAEFDSLGFSARITNKGGVVIDLGGECDDDGLLIEAHIDTIGAMVAEVKGNGRLRLTNLGGSRAHNLEAECARIYTRGGKVYEGTLQLCNASIHVNKDYNDIKRSYDTTELVIDEDVKCADDTRKLGIMAGDIVAFDPKFKVTESGYIKSRYLDDKLSVGILLAYAKYLRDENVTLKRHTYMHLTVYEEVGHGGAASVPVGITEAIAVDMGCIGDGLGCTEKTVAICAKDARGPYSYKVTSKLIEAAKNENADFAVDVYSNYSSDVDTTLAAGYDIRHGLIGPGVYASHGYERSHISAVESTLKVLKGYSEL